jgi:hypothetical protein
VAVGAGLSRDGLWKSRREAAPAVWPNAPELHSLVHMSVHQWLNLSVSPQSPNSEVERALRARLVWRKCETASYVSHTRTECAYHLELKTGEDLWVATHEF